MVINTMESFVRPLCVKCLICNNYRALICKSPYLYKKIVWPLSVSPYLKNIHIHILTSMIMWLLHPPRRLCFSNVCLCVSACDQPNSKRGGWIWLNCACRCHSRENWLTFVVPAICRVGPKTAQIINFFRKYAIPRPGSSESDRDEILYSYNLYFRQILHCGSSW